MNVYAAICKRGGRWRAEAEQGRGYANGRSAPEPETFLTKFRDSIG